MFDFPDTEGREQAMAEIDSTEFLVRRRNRATGQILGHCERAPWYAGLTSQQRRDLRGNVLDAMVHYHDATLDAFRSVGGDGGVTNEKIWEALERIHANTAGSPG